MIFKRTSGIIILLLLGLSIFLTGTGVAFLWMLVFKALPWWLIVVGTGFTSWIIAWHILERAMKEL